MKILKLGFVVILLFATCAPALADMTYGDYIEAFNAGDNSTTFYIYKSTIGKSNGVISFEALEVKSKLDIPKSKKGEPYLAMKYKFKYNCPKRLYTEAMTEVLEVESGWGKIYPDQVARDDSTWRPVPNDQNFNSSIFQAFCKK